MGTRTTIPGLHHASRRVGRVLALLAIVATLLASSRAQAAPPAFVVAAEPRWIAPVEPLPATDASESMATTSNGRHHLLYDHQVRVFGKEEESYWRWSRRITNESGLQALSQVTIDFDATYQTLVLHGVKVRRGNETLDRLNRDAIRIVQREPELERQVISGLKSAVLFVSDLRVGDIVDFAYTLRGADPTLDGRYVDSLLLGLPEPVERVHVRVLLPTSRHVSVVHHGPEERNERFLPKVEAGADVTEYRWDLRHVPAYEAQVEAPSWHQFYPWVQVSEFASWKEVASWGTRLFSQPLPKQPQALNAWVQATLRTSSSLDAFLLRATRFVQDEVRYVGIEIGMGRRLPSPPSEVFDRRYGDCKDKTALLVALLRSAGISAYPILVSSSNGHTLRRWAPSPGAFDHAIVEATGAEGRSYFIDPTLTLQGGGLSAFLYSAYEHALRLDDGATALEPLAGPSSEGQSMKVTDTFAIASPGGAGATKLDVEHLYRGDLADALRRSSRASSREQLGKYYVELYQAHYPSLQEARPLEQIDERELNVIVVRGHFTIPQFWKWSEAEHHHAGEVAGFILDTLLKRPAAPKPDVPIAVIFPRNVQHVLHLNLPFDLPLEPQRVDARSAAFIFAFKAEQIGRTISYTYDLVTRAPAALPADVTEHVAAVDQARLALARMILFRPPWAGGPNWTAIAVALGLVPILLWGARGFRRYDPPAAPAADHASGPVGLAGWLYLVGLGVVVTPIRNVVAMLDGGKVVFSLSQWQALTTASSASYSPALAVLTAVELVVLAVFVVLSGVLIELFFRKRRSFPPLYCIVLLAAAAYALVDHVVASTLLSESQIGTTTTLHSVRTVIHSGIWVAYLRLSKRVTATFVN